MEIFQLPTTKYQAPHYKATPSYSFWWGCHNFPYSK